MSTKNGKPIPLRSADQTNSRKILSNGWNQENVIGTINGNTRIFV